MLEVTDIEGIYLNYEGPLNIRIISTLATFLSENIIAPINLRKKLYRVFIELTQNVALYSFDRIKLINSTNNGKGMVYIINNPSEFQCVTINKIQKEHCPVLIKNCTDINATSAHALKDKRNELRRQAYNHDTGAHIGLIMIRIYSGNPIDFEIINTNKDEMYIKITATISKKNPLLEMDKNFEK